MVQELNNRLSSKIEVLNNSLNRFNNRTIERIDNLEKINKIIENPEIDGMALDICAKTGGAAVANRLQMPIASHVGITRHWYMRKKRMVLLPS